MPRKSKTKTVATKLTQSDLSDYFYNLEIAISGLEDAIENAKEANLNSDIISNLQEALDIAKQAHSDTYEELD